jgi:hypothetical protein
MKDKSLLAIILILIAGIVSFAALGCNRGAIRAQAASTEAVSSSSRDTKVVAYYFHGTSRCYTCRRIEAQAHDVVTSEFGSQLKANRLEWQSVNVEQPGNEHFFTDYKLVSWSLVLVTYRNGKQADYKVLNDVWTLVNNEQAFRSYVKGGIQVALERIS